MNKIEVVPKSSEHKHLCPEMHHDFSIEKVSLPTAWNAPRAFASSQVIYLSRLDRRYRYSTSTHSEGLRGRIDYGESQWNGNRFA